MAKLNKDRSTAEILEKGIIHPCTKLASNNIIFPNWDDTGLLGQILQQYSGMAVLSLINGKVLVTGRPSYCWKFGKITSDDLMSVGTRSASAILNLCNLLSSSSMQEKTLVAGIFANMTEDLLLVTTHAEERHCIEVTQELYDSGITACVDEWMVPDENGEAEATPLQIGDYLIVTTSGVYRVSRDEFVVTHITS